MATTCWLSAVPFKLYINVFVHICMNKDLKQTVGRESGNGGYGPRYYTTVGREDMIPVTIVLLVGSLRAGRAWFQILHYW